MAQVMTMMDVHKLAVLLETKRLELLSMQYIEASVNVDSVLQVLSCASELKLAGLKDYCMKFIVRESNFRKVIMSTAFESLDQPLMVQIVCLQQFRSRPNSPDPHAEEDVVAATVSTLQDSSFTPTSAVCSQTWHSKRERKRGGGGGCQEDTVLGTQYPS